jgi:ribonucleoside-diphosphate reductase alpha chain
MPVGQWVWENFDKISGISFLPKSDHVYAQAPFESISKETYAAYQHVDVDFKMLSHYELTDTTTSSHTMACTAGACEVIDLKG